MRSCYGLLFLLLSCKAATIHQFPRREGHSRLTGSDFYRTAAGFGWKQRDSMAINWIREGQIPSFLRRFSKIENTVYDSTTRHNLQIVYYVSPDYLSVGNNRDWARLCITPMAAEAILSAFDCGLPTRKMVDDIYRQAAVKLSPAPMVDFRDSTPTMWQHHLIIEKQRQGQKGLIGGIKKDVVNSSATSSGIKKNRVAIYGWHRLDGTPIQPLYTGHVNWYVDYSHGIRMVWNKMWVNGKEMRFEDVLLHPVFSKLICDENQCAFSNYLQNAR